MIEIGEKRAEWLQESEYLRLRHHADDYYLSNLLGHFGVALGWLIGIPAAILGAFALLYGAVWVLHTLWRLT